jgi:hypothetical protein
MTTASEWLPALPPPPGESFRILPTGPSVFGPSDFRVRLTGGAQLRGVRLFVDGEPQGDRMLPLGHGLYHQEVDTSLFVDGVHEIGAAGLAVTGQFVMTARAEIAFHNVDHLRVVSATPRVDGTGYMVDFVLASLRAQVPAESFKVFDQGDERREELQVAVGYKGGASDGLPVGTLHLRRASGELLAPGGHHVSVTFADLQGRTRAYASVEMTIR